MSTTKQKKSGKSLRDRLEIVAVSFGMAILCIPAAITVATTLIILGLLSLIPRRGGP